MVHRAKVDLWLAVLIGGVALVDAALATKILIAPSSGLHGSLGVGLLLAVAGLFPALILWGCYRTRYDVTASELVVCFGPFRTRIPLNSITEVFPTNNPLSAPAPSLDRLRINYAKANGKTAFALVSPKDKETFVRDLQSHAEQLRSVPGEPLRLQAGKPL